jgi:hypothetical protein
MSANNTEYTSPLPQDVRVDHRDATAGFRHHDIQYGLSVELAVHRQRPHPNSLFTRSLDGVGRRLQAPAKWFATLPRHMRRRLSCQYGAALESAALATVLGGKPIQAAEITVT